MIIGFMIVVIGISLLELVVFIVSVLWKYYDIVFGNIVGFNILNLLVVLFVVVVIYLIEISFIMLICDYGVMCGVMLLLVLFMFLLRKVR